MPTYYSTHRVAMLDLVSRSLAKFKTWVNTQLSGKQNNLVSGTNIKTVNRTSVLGSGNIEIVKNSSTNWTETDTSPSFNAVKQKLDTKADTNSLHTVATSGSYNDLTDKPTIPTVPTKVSAFTNDSKYVIDQGSSVTSVIKGHGSEDAVLASPAGYSAVNVNPMGVDIISNWSGNSNGSNENGTNDVKIETGLGKAYYNNQEIAVKSDIKVTSVNGQIGDVNLSIPTKVSDLSNDSGFITQSDVPDDILDLATSDDYGKYYLESSSEIQFCYSPPGGNSAGIELRSNGVGFVYGGNSNEILISDGISINNYKFVYGSNSLLFLYNNLPAITIDLQFPYPSVTISNAKDQNGTPYLTAHLDISGKADKSTTYTKTEVDNLIPDETAVSNWGFTKNTGTYSKPSTGIPATDLESYVLQVLTRSKVHVYNVEINVGYSADLRANAVLDSNTINIASLEEDITNGVYVIIQLHGTDNIYENYYLAYYNGEGEYFFASFNGTYAYQIILKDDGNGGVKLKSNPEEFQVESKFSLNHKLSASYINETTSKKFVSDTEKNTWNAIADLVVLQLLEIDALKLALSNNLGNVNVVSIDMEQYPKVCGSNWILTGTTTPHVTPRFVGLMYIDSNSNVVYVATKLTNSVNDWKLV